MLRWWTAPLALHSLVSSAPVAGILVQDATNIIHWLPGRSVLVPCALCTFMMGLALGLGITLLGPEKPATDRGQRNAGVPYPASKPGPLIRLSDVIILLVLCCLASMPVLDVDAVHEGLIMGTVAGLAGIIVPLVALYARWNRRDLL